MPQSFVQVQRESAAGAIRLFIEHLYFICPIFFRLADRTLRNFKNCKLKLPFLDFYNALSNHCTVAWVKQTEHPKGVKDEVKQARRAQRIDT